MSKNFDREEAKVYTSLDIMINETTLTLKNIDVERLVDINREEILTMFEEVAWYNYGIYDKIAIFGDVYTITKITKKAIMMVRHN